MSGETILRVAGRLAVLLLLAWFGDYLVIQNLSDEHFQTGKSIEVVVMLALAWRYCMPASRRR